MAKLLLKKKADVNLVDSEGKSVLMVACENGCSRIVELLLFKKSPGGFARQASEVSSDVPV